MNVLTEYLNKPNISLKTLYNLPKSTQIENSEKLSNKTSKGVIYIKFGGTKNDLPKQLEVSSQIHIKQALVSGVSSSLSNKGIEAFTTTNSSRQVDTLPRIISRDDIKNKLRAFEKKYNKSSDTFYSDWKQGKAIDNLDTLKWATYYEMWQNKYFM